MCLILFSYMNHPDYKLVLAANRDEFYSRPTQPLEFWDDFPSILAGRDQQNRGTWLGVTTGGRFSAITNFRAPSLIKAQAPSRGLLVSGFLQSDRKSQAYLESIRLTGKEYNGFNLLAGDADGLCYYSNMGQDVMELRPGTYGLSNAFLDTSWPKVDTGKREFDRIIRGKNEISIDSLFDMLADASCPGDGDLPDTGVGLPWERLLAPIFIDSESYGTRSSAVVLVDYHHRVRFVERTYLKKPSGGFDHDTRTRLIDF